MADTLENESHYHETHPNVSDKLQTEDDSQDYEVDEKNNIIIDSRIKFFLISLENWLFDSAENEDSP